MRIKWNWNGIRRRTTVSNRWNTSEHWWVWDEPFSTPHAPLMGCFFVFFCCAGLVRGASNEISAWHGHAAAAELHYCQMCFVFQKAVIESLNDFLLFFALPSWQLRLFLLATSFASNCDHSPSIYSLLPTAASCHFLKEKIHAVFCSTDKGRLCQILFNNSFIVSSSGWKRGRERKVAS